MFIIIIWKKKFCFSDKEDDGNPSLIQCFFFDDWFHEKHLNIFRIDLENVKEEDLPVMPLVCNNCVIKLKDILKGYDLKKIVYGLMPKVQNETSKLTETNDNNKENEPLSLLGKKRKPSNDLEEIKEEDKDNQIYNNQNILNIQEIKEKKICNKNLDLYSENEEFLTQVIQNKQNLFIDGEIFFKKLCHCDECSKLYEEIGMNFMKEENAFEEWSKRITFEDKITDENFIDEMKKNESFSFEEIYEKDGKDFFQSYKYKQLPVEKQILFRVCFAELKDKFKEFILSLDHKEITLEDIYNFINKNKDYFENLKNN